MSEYVYRVLTRGRQIRVQRVVDGRWMWVPVEDPQFGEWTELITNRGGGRSYQSRGAANGVATREKKYALRCGRELETKVQRRPLGEWEDLDD